MTAFGDVLRNLGSVLNPAVEQEMGAEARAQQQAAQQVGMFALQRQGHQQDAERQQRLLEASPEYQMKVEALKNEKGFREAVAGAQGDQTKIASAAMQFGKPELAVNIFNHAEARRDKLDMHRQSIEAKKEELTTKLADKALDRDSREQMQQMLLSIKQQSLALQGEIARGNQDLKRLQFTMKGDQDLQKEVQKLGGALEKAGLTTADAVLGNVEESIKKNPKVAEWISGPKSAIPDMLAPDDVKTARQDFQKLFNITLKDRSGAAVTNQELERLKSEFATGVFKTDKQLTDAVEKARGIINKHYASVAAGFGKPALEAFNENIRGLGGKVVLEPPTAKAAPVKITGDADYAKLPAGTQYIAPDGSTRVKQ